MPDEFDVSKFAAELVNSNIDRFLDIGSGVLKGASQKMCALLRRTYSAYLKRASERYSTTKTFFLRDEPAPLYRFYVPLGIAIAKKNIRHTSIAELASATSCAVITGTAGCGKTTLMRHLFLDSIKDKTRVPVFIELRHLNNSDEELRDLLYSTLESQGLKLDDAYIAKAFEDGHFVILLDGFDELDVAVRPEISMEIQSLARQWNKNVFVISSRPDEQFSGWNGFTVFKTLPLNVEEAVELVEKLPFDELTKQRFVDDLRTGLFSRHKSFLSNPLLLSIMLLTYGQSGRSLRS